MAVNKALPQAPWGEYVPNTGPLTVEQFETLADEHGWTFELHQGRLIRMPGPGYIHALISNELSFLITTFLKQVKLGRMQNTGCYYLALADGKEELLCPDLSYILPAREATMELKGSYAAIAPDWVIEIASPNDYRPQMQKKMQVYLEAGVRLGWVIWPNSQTIDIWRPGDTIMPSQMANFTETLDLAEVIPGLTLSASAIFDA